MDPIQADSAVTPKPLEMPWDAEPGAAMGDDAPDAATSPVPPADAVPTPEAAPDAAPAPVTN